MEKLIPWSNISAAINYNCEKHLVAALLITILGQQKLLGKNPGSQFNLLGMNFKNCDSLQTIK